MKSLINRALQIAIRNLEAMSSSLSDEEFFLILSFAFALYGSDLRGPLSGVMRKAFARSEFFSV
jgi:hypothetical protein